ncbi:nucleoside deaminase [Hymenobacter sp. 15J16-1T3B]|uniref:nucleoside deaminase n=1 Tax=Hymenobacter sp. 15J16-1T3B TaxID=2886941 RepID=UPI001D11A58C|nr:nucleoside deaminase [Hymenobacter sp. 15J16-1T3B]MCC3159765.1 nucleoside deaminase [Hymenobacter sp. 15J16-1T3B]
MPPSPPDPRYYLQRCRELGAAAARHGESAVGALVVHEGVIVAEGQESSRRTQDITYHAEVVAIRAACQALHQPKLAGATLYSSHEPCILCSYVIRHVGIARVVVGRPSAHVGGLTSAYPVLSAELPIWGPPPLVHILEP